MTGALALALLLALVALYYARGLAGFIAPISTPDEFGYLSIAALLNGHGWQAVASTIPWYGFGYSLVLAPAFALTHVSAWYGSAQWVNIGLIVVLGVCANQLLRRLDVAARPGVRYVVVALVLLYPALVFYARLALSETLVAVMPWLLGLLVHRSFEKPGRYVAAFACGCLLMAAYYVHARLIVMVAAGLVVFVFMAVRMRRWRLLGAVVLGMVVVLVPAHWFKAYLLAHLYGGAIIGSQQSPVLMTELVLRRMGSLQAWRDLVGSAAGQLAYQLIASLGLLVAGIVACWSRIRESVRGRDVAVVATIAFLALAAIGCYVLVLFTMGMSPKYPQHVFYGRYTEPLLLPIVALGLLHLHRKPGGAPLWFGVAIVAACALVPVGVYVAHHVAHQTTFWDPIAGLFTYKTADWRLGIRALVFGFLAVCVVLAAAFRLHRHAGLAVVAALFLCANRGLIDFYVQYPAGFVKEWVALPLPGSSHPPATIKVGGDEGPGWLARIQVINAGATVIPAKDWPSGFHGRYELMEARGKEVDRFACQAAAASGASCAPIDPPPEPEVRLEFRAGNSVGARAAILPTALQQTLSTAPYLRAVWRDIALTHARLRYEIQAPLPEVMVLKAYVTQPGQTRELANATLFHYVPEGRSGGSIRMPIPVRGYLGAPLQPGFYTLHVVAQSRNGSARPAEASIPMRIR